MALKGSSVACIIVIIIGVIITIIGIILYELNNRNKKTQPWWVWAMLIAGPVIAIIAGIILAFTLRE